MAQSPLEGFDLVTRHLVIERDLNPAGNLFGGTMLAWLDEATALPEAERDQRRITTLKEALGEAGNER